MSILLNLYETRDKISYSAAISNGQTAGQWQLGLTLLSSMLNLKETPDKIR